MSPRPRKRPRQSTTSQPRRAVGPSVGEAMEDEMREVLPNSLLDEVLDHLGLDKSPLHRTALTTALSELSWNDKAKLVEFLGGPRSKLVRW